MQDRLVADVTPGGRRPRPRRGAVGRGSPGRQRSSGGLVAPGATDPPLDSTQPLRSRPGPVL